MDLYRAFAVLEHTKRSAYLDLLDRQEVRNLSAANGRAPGAAHSTSSCHYVCASFSLREPRHQDRPQNPVGK